MSYKNALVNINKTNFFPPIGKKRIQGMIETRLTGAFQDKDFGEFHWANIYLDKNTHQPIIDDEVNFKVYDIFKKEGSDAWYKRDISDFLGQKYKAENYIKVDDIVEVWFDPGSTHSYVLENRKDLDWPADMYLEGSDQHRGWFHSSFTFIRNTRPSPL